MHDLCLHWLRTAVASDHAYGVSDLALSGFLRVVTNPRVFAVPTPLADALNFARTVRDQPNSVIVQPGPRHWSIFMGLCQTSAVKGNLVPDAYLAALAIESGSRWVTTDRDYARFAGLTWTHPADA